MLGYFLKRVLLAIPTLMVISFIAFYLKCISPGDPVEAKMGFQISEQYSVDREFLRSSYELTAREFYLDLPLFYFSIQPPSIPDAYFHQIYPERKEWLKKCSRQTGNGADCQRLLNMMLALQDAWSQLDLTDPNAGDLVDGELTNIPAMLYDMGDELTGSDTLSDIHSLLEETHILYETTMGEKRPWLNFLPMLRWHGPSNQYHRWLISFVKGEYGISMIDGRPIGSKVREAAKWTLSMNTIALVLIFLFGIPLGVYLSINKGKWISKGLSLLVYSLYALPLFWIATMAVVFLTTDAYGAWTNWFPAVGHYEVPSSPGFFGYFGFALSKLMLPILCIVLASVAYVSIQMRNNMEKAFETKYFLAAASRGLPKSLLIRRHAFPNALYSMVSILSQAIPALIGGSVVIELIFNISGMGRLMWSSLFGEDYEVVISIVMLGAVFTVAGQLIADLIYSLLNPAVRYTKQD